MTNRIGELWQELVRRRVVRTTAAYAALSFVALQLGEILLPAFERDLAGLRSLFATLLAGFPAVVAVSWVYDVTVDGLRRTRPVDEAADQSPVVAKGPSKRLVAAVVASAVGLGAFGWWVVEGVPVGGAIPASVSSMLLSGAVLLVIGWWSVHEGDLHALRAVDGSDVSLAVLPFVNLGPAEGPRFLGDALADDVRNRLSAVEGLRVVARTSSAVSSESSADARSVGRALGVELLLEGSVLRSQGHMWVAVQLIDTDSGFGEWSGTYACSVDEHLTCLGGIARAIVADLLSSTAGARWLRAS